MGTEIRENLKYTENHEWLKVKGNSIGKMIKEDLCIFRWSNYQLSEGENKIEVIGTSGKKKPSDSCTWTLISNIRRF